ncbi:MAG: methionyl-tRNA formyltransferase [Thermodesulfobacteriota bacterium]
MKAGPWRLIFLGTPDFAVPALEALLAAGEAVLAVVTQPDRPRGRGRQVSPPPVKDAALAHGLPVLQPARLKDPELLQTLAALKPEVMVVAAYGRILTPEILALPSAGFLNVHASLLPKYRGAAPINWALIRGEKETGVTIMWVTLEVDTGPIFLQERVAILPEDNAGALTARLAERGAALLVQALELLRRGEGRRLPQPETGVSLAPPIAPEMRRLDWSRPAVEVAGWIRGLDPKPGAYTLWQGQRLKLFRPRVRKTAGSLGTPGKVLGLRPEGLEIACGQGSITVPELQLAGHKRLAAPEFLRGHALVGETLG